MSSERAQLKSLLAEFYEEKRRLKSPYYQYDESKEKLGEALDRAVDNCIELTADPKCYIEAVYRNYEEAAGLNSKLSVFFPNFLHPKNIGEKYAKYMGTMTNSDTSKDKNIMESYFRTQVRYLHDAVTLANREPLEVLMDDFIDLAPWFRILITKDPEPELIKKYLPRAKAYMTQELRTFLATKGMDLNRIYGKQRI